MNDAEIAEQIKTHLKGGRLVDVQVTSGQPNGFLLVLENDQEERGSLGLQPGLNITVSPGEVTARPKVQFNIQTFRK